MCTTEREQIGAGWLVSLTEQVRPTGGTFADYAMPSSSSAKVSKQETWKLFYFIVGVASVVPSTFLFTWERGMEAVRSSSAL